MTTQPHQNNTNGYALRIGKKLPKHAANLAYMHTDTPAPTKNVIINDLTGGIPENSLRLDEQDSMHTFINEKGELETPTGVLELDRPDILLTNEYSIGETNTPLYFSHRSRYLFDARRNVLAHPINGKTVSRGKLFEEYTQDEASRFVLQSDKVVLKRDDGTNLLAGEDYKLVLDKAGEEDYLYRIIVYTSFDGTGDSYQLHYPAYGHGNHIETLNPHAVFSEFTSQANSESTRSYQVVSQPDGTYRIVLPTEDNRFLITEESRPAHTFEYQLTSHIQTRLSDKNPLNVNIGIVYINDTIINATRVTSALRKLVHNNPYMPEYVTFKNPHRNQGYHDKSDVMYWEADLNMPMEHWLDYDVLIITGYGDKDFTNARDNMRAYLDTGGILLFDTTGEGQNVLNPINQQGAQTFVANISYSPTEQELTHRQFTTEAKMRDRYYDVKEEEELGRIQPTIRLHGEENIDDWDVFLAHSNGGPSLMRKKTGSIGQLIVSNMGWMLDVLFGKEKAIQFFSNFLLYLLEERSFISPIVKDHVYHKDDLYETEYTSFLGEVNYYDDRGDEDATQIVAKKVLHPEIETYAKQFLPDAYRNYQSARFDVSVNDSGEIPLVNADFEQANREGITEWESTVTDALPGFDFIRFSGDSTRGEHAQSIRRSGRRSLSVQTTDAQGFFEQDLGYLPEGRYELKSYIRGVSAGGGGVGVYNQNGEVIASTASMTGTFNWRQEAVHFELTEPTLVFLRLGAHDRLMTTHLYFDDVSLHTTSVIRMTPESTGGEALYAYATTPKGKNNQLNHYENNQLAKDVLKIDAETSATLSVKSYVYQWFSAEGRFKKEYGNQKNTRFTIRSSQGQHTLGSLQEFLPALKSGAEWARKDRVYYEISLEPNEYNPYINLSLYDPSVDTYFFTPQGEWVLNHEDLWWNGYDATVQLRAELSLYYLQATSNEYMVKPKPENQLRVLNPRTEDERDRWYLSIQNGSFQKHALQMTDQEDVTKSGRESYYQDFLVGEHTYQLPEYRRQSFYPRHGERLINDELAVYRDEYKIEVQNTPLRIKEEEVTKEPLVVLNSERTVWNSAHVYWDKNTLPSIFIDEWSNGSLSLQTDGFVIDYEEGTVTFTKPVEGVVYASYSHDNFVIKRRRYANNKITAELMRSRDNFTFELAHPNIAHSPQPLFYRGTRSEASVVNPSEYTIDYEAGTITFFEETRVRVYADYLYFEEDELSWIDANQQTGEITTKERVSFKDEVYVTYVAKENNYIYKGYFDRELGTFMHLDLNPTAGHTFSQKEKIDTGWEVLEVESEKLLNKEIYLYLLPSHSLYYKTERLENHPTRHAFGEDEWAKIKAAHPEALLLATIHVRENTAPENIVTMDARRSGGGLKETVSQETIDERVGYTSAFWDIGSFDGMAYYKNGVSVIHIPDKVLEENGGQFSEQQVRDVVDKFLAYGTYPIIEYVEAQEEGESSE